MSDIDEYNLVYDIAIGCSQLCKTVTDVFSTAKIRDLLLYIFNLLRVSYQKNEALQGFSNLLIVIEIVINFDLVLFNLMLDSRRRDSRSNK